MHALLDVIRRAALPGIWSQGVKLARSNAVTAASGTSREATARVRAPGLAIAPTVTLYAEGLEWTCDCDAKFDPCAHVVAAAIAFTSAPVTEEASSGARKSAPKLVYRVETEQRLLLLKRVIVHPDGREQELRGSLSSDVARRSLPAELTPTHEDLEVDRVIATHPRAAVPEARVRDVLEALSRSAEVSLGGERVAVSGEPILPRAVVEDGTDGAFVLRIERDPAITEVVAMGVVRCGNTLHPIGQSQTTGPFLERLPLSKSFAPDQRAELVTELLPELEKRMPVLVRTGKLPQKSKDVRPRIALDLSHQGHALSVLPLLVYGDPSIARVDGDALVAFGGDVPVRRHELERELLHRLRDELNLVPGRRVDFDGGDALRFAEKLRKWQRLSGETAAEIADRPLTARIVIADGGFDVVFEHPGGEGDSAAGAEPVTADPQSVLQAWREGLSLVPLSDGGWAPLPAEWLAEHGDRIADLLVARDQDGKLPVVALPELGALCEALELPRPLGLDKLAPLLEGFAGIARAALPDGLTATLRSYQEAAVDWLAFLRNAELGGILADDMGLGKTLEALCALNGRVLVVCPRSVVYNWAAEIARFRPGLRAAIYHGPKRELDPAADVTLTTYAVLRLDAERLAAESWDAVVLDEAQAIKNPDSQTARAAYELRGRFRVALSGTPIENRLEELWSIMHFCNPGLLGGRSDFDERYAKRVAAGDARVAAALRSKIRPFVLRRTKREVLPELPPRTEVVLYVELEDSERAVYDAVRAATKQRVVDELAGGKGALAVLEALLRLRQAACHSGLVPGQHAEGSSKLERLLEALEEATSEGHRALVFSQWTSFLDLVEPKLDAAQIGYTRLDGTTRDRGAVVAEFQSEAGPPVMLISLKAGGTGLNLTAADHVFLLDPWWNPAVEDQAADRAHRIGQDRPVLIHRMVSKDTVEERILVLKEKKRALSALALGAADHAGRITREELLALLD